jgi:pimeloyl-ACP methyl ester carboxylesterase
MQSSEVSPINGNKMDFESMITERSIRLGDFEIYCKLLHETEFQTKPVLIFLHEGLGTTEIWGSFAYELAKTLDLPALIYDRRGYGKSSPHSWVGNSNYLHEEAHLLYELLESLRIKVPIVFGHSDGATIALIYGGLYRVKPAGIISVAAHTFLERQTYIGVKKTIKLYETSRFKQKLEKRLAEKTDDVFYSWALTWASDSLSEWNIFEEIEKIICPVLVIQGDNDQYGTAEQVFSITKRNQENSKHHIISNCGHIPHLEKKEEMLEKCAKFVKNTVFDKIKLP